MKAMVCELCGSNDLVKQNGAFVCRHCGTKYSVEEAKKLMGSDTVDVSGSKVILKHYLCFLFNDTQNQENDPTMVTEFFYSTRFPGAIGKYAACFRHLT